jgi:carboxypeptidase T
MSTQAGASASQAAPDRPVVARVYFSDRADLDQLANRLDIWEVNHAAGYLLALLSPTEYERLAQAGYQLEIDPARTAEANQPLERLPGQGPDSFPGYPCYRTVEEDYADMQALADANPGLASWIDIGNSWEKETANGLPGYDIYALKLTNTAIPDPKPTFFLMAEIHARELVTAETAARFAEYLIANYGVDPDITWLLDYYKVYIVTMTNPDGRKKAESGLSWRKNTDNDDGCSNPNYWGTDLNRNHSFKWGLGGSSGDPCDETYRGPLQASEPETNAIQDFVATLFPDQRGDSDSDPAPLDATGTFVTLHSYSQLVLWPWGWTPTDAPNNTQLQTLGRKMAYFNSYSPQQSYQLYATSGTSDDWAYGELGVAAYTYEMGTSFFQDCGSFESTIYPDNREALMAAFKSARLPYMEPSGPDALNVTVLPAAAAPGEPVQVSATMNDTRFNNSNGAEPTQNIAAAEYTIDTPPWSTDPVAIAHPMTAADGNFNQKVEGVVGTIDTTGLDLGRHMVFVRGQDASGNWGVISAAFLYIIEPGVPPSLEGYVRDAATNQPLAATVKAGSFQAASDPATGFYSMTVISGTYNVTAEAADHAPLTVSGIQAQNYQTVTQDFYLSPACVIFSDTVENGNQGWTAQNPWAITTEASHSATHSWTESPGTDYGDNLNTSLTSQTFNLGGYTRVTLGFWHIYDTEPGWDYGYVEYSINGGSAWTQAASYSGYNHLTWEQQTIQLAGLDGQAKAQLRFRFHSDVNTTADGWHVDDISLTGSGPSCNTSLAPTAEFTSSATTVGLGEPIQFVDLTYGTPPFTYQWDFGDGTGVSSDANPAYTYTATGLYTVTLAVTNSLGSDSISHVILIQPSACVPVEQVELNLLNPGPPWPGEVAHFSAGILPENFTRPVSFTVDFNDGSLPIDGSSSSAPIQIDHAFALEGDYPVTIAAWNCAMTVPVTSTLLTNVISYTAGLAVSPLNQAGSGDPGTPVTYTLSVTNTGEYPDSIYPTLVEAAWQTSFPDSIGPLASGGSASLVVTVTVPAEAAAAAWDAASLQFASTHPSVEPVTVLLVTTANTIYRFAVSSPESEKVSPPGSVVTYTLNITNTGNITDTFDLEVDSLWEVSLADSTDPLGSGESLALTVVVTIPVQAQPNTSDTAVVTVTSQGDSRRCQEISLVTTARWNEVWIPFMLK